MSERFQKFKRVKRSNDLGEAHALTFTCYKRQPFLARERCCLWLAESIQNARATHGFHLWAYVFMPEHVHLVIWPGEDGASSSRVLFSIKQSVARKATIFLREHNPKGLDLLATGQKHSPYRFWQDGGGYDRNFFAGKALLSAVQYIHDNPVRKGLVSHAEDWKWSSALEWSMPGQGPIRVDRDSFPMA